MRKRKSPSIVILACVAITLSVFAVASQAQDTKEADQKLFEAIAGDYEFEYQGQYMVFVFAVEDGKLTGGPQGEGAEVMERAEGEETTFFAYSPDGIEYRFKFMKDEEGKFDRCLCTVPDMGLEIEGAKIK